MNIKTKIILGLGVILVLSAIGMYIAEAASFCYPNNTTCTTYAQGYHGVSNSSGSYWSANVTSKTISPPLNMDDIGYGYWNVKAHCNGQWMYGWTSPSGSVLHNTSLFYASKTVLKPFCTPAGGRAGFSNGSHDFYKWPNNHMYFNTSASASIP